MKYSTKPNHSKIFHTELVKYKEINVIKINSEDRTIELIKINNSISTIQKSLNFYNYNEILLKKDSMDRFIVGVDEDLKTKKSFRFKGIDEDYFGNAVLVKIPKSEDMEKLQSTNISIELVRKLIIFNE